MAVRSLQWRHNESDAVSNHRRLDCLLNRLFKPRSKKTSKLRVTSLCEGNSPVTGEFPALRPVTRKMCPFGDVITVVGYIQLAGSSLGKSNNYLVMMNWHPFQHPIHLVTWSQHCEIDFKVAKSFETWSAPRQHLGNIFQSGALIYTTNIAA